MSINPLEIFPTYVPAAGRPDREALDERLRKDINEGGGIRYIKMGEPGAFSKIPTFDIVLSNDAKIRVKNNATQYSYNYTPANGLLPTHGGNIDETRCNNLKKLAPCDEPDDDECLLLWNEKDGLMIFDEHTVEEDVCYKS